MTAEEIESIISATLLRKISVTAYAYDPQVTLDVVAAGVDSIEHGDLVKDKGLKQMKHDGMFLVPTLTVAELLFMVKRFLRGREA